MSGGHHYEGWSWTNIVPGAQHVLERHSESLFHDQESGFFYLPYVTVVGPNYLVYLICYDASPDMGGSEIRRWLITTQAFFPETMNVVVSVGG